jgi:hypothetical protein
VLPTDERYVAQRNPLYRHEERSKRQKFRLNAQTLKEPTAKALKFWENDEEE